MLLAISVACMVPFFAFGKDNHYWFWMIVGPIACFMIGIEFVRPPICVRHGCKIDVGSIGYGESFQRCDMCSAEQHCDRERAAREIRIEEIAEGFRRANVG